MQRAQAKLKTSKAVDIVPFITNTINSSKTVLT